MAQRPPPPGNNRNPYATQRQYYDNDNDPARVGGDPRYAAARSTTALIGAQESTPNFQQFPAYGAFTNQPCSTPYAGMLTLGLSCTWLNNDVNCG